jgi:ankyrin repeat protein
MKFQVAPLILMVTMLLGASSCGKKAKDHHASVPDQVMQASEAALIAETHKELYAAILANDIVKVRKLLEAKTQLDLNIILEDGESLITTAVSRDLYPIVELLLENNASLYKSNKQNESPLMVASKKGHENLVRLLLSLGSRPDTKDLNGNTALHLAILNNHEEIALYLINSRSNIDITNNLDQTALKLAEVRNLKKVIDLLRSLTQSSVGLPSKAEVRNIITLGDLTSLNLLFNKYPVLAQDYKDLNFYVLIMRSHPHDKALSMTNLLVSFGANLEGPNGAEITPLIEAVKQSYEDFVELMLKENVNPNMVDDKGLSALIWAIKNNNLSIVKRLIDKNATQKYTYYLNGSKKTMSSCDVARDMKKKVTTSEAKKTNEDILDTLGCGLRWLF